MTREEKAREIATKIFYSPATNGQSETSIDNGVKMILEYADQQIKLIEAAEKVVSLYDQDTGDSVVEWTYALRKAVKELKEVLKP